MGSDSGDIVCRKVREVREVRMLPKMAEQGRIGNITFNLKEPGNASSLLKPLGITSGKPRYLPGANEQCLYKSADL